MTDPIFVIDATDVSPVVEPDVAALTGETGLVTFVEAADVDALLEAWAAVSGVTL